jgi:hypothetical protein
LGIEAATDRLKIHDVVLEGIDLALRSIRISIAPPIGRGRTAIHRRTFSLLALIRAASSS